MIDLDKLNEVVNRYEQKFGADSLDRTIYIDPLRLTDESVAEAVKILQVAIENNTPIEQFEKEIWETMIF